MDKFGGSGFISVIELRDVWAIEFKMLILCS